MAEYKLLTKDFGIEGLQTLPVYERTGGYQGLRKALRDFTPEALIEEVKTSQIRGRGGAGFPTGMKWSFLPKDVFPRYLCCNADESEPGCFKDRYLIDESPHQLVEGLLIAAYALQVQHAFVYIRGEYHDQRILLEQAVEEARAAGYIGTGILGSDFGCDVIVHGGAGAYICGEETALISSLEGNRGEPRLKPPFPAVKGLYGKPTVVNNVETLCNLPHIVNNGGEWFAGIGAEKSRGTRLWCCSGHIEKPGVYEMELGRPIRELFEEHCGGMWKGRTLKAFQPGGGSMQVLLPEHIDLPLDMDAVMKAGSSLGAGAMMFMDETTCLVNVSMRLVDFYQHESCGKCAPCREGTYFESDLMHKLEAGRATAEELATLTDICDNMNGKCFCPLGDTATWFVMSAYKAFRDEFESHVGAGQCPVQARNRAASVAA
ncbi:MAG TPA: NADH-quinone oxidoreductase subunit NuoF [Candidatus Dormibacteraeota bacterium]|jgi:NADH-quinone oxidoreductase subunit F|nr:NADH-quinone oxidoreductase subunit NuoF [Candidatus Dormibacteraeota bacterium]